MTSRWKAVCWRVGDTLLAGLTAHRVGAGPARGAGRTAALRVYGRDGPGIRSGPAAGAARKSPAVHADAARRHRRLDPRRRHRSGAAAASVDRGRLFGQARRHRRRPRAARRRIAADQGGLGHRRGCPARTVIDNGPPAPGPGPAPPPPLPSAPDAGPSAPMPGLTEVQGQRAHGASRTARRRQRRAARRRHDFAFAAARGRPFRRLLQPGRALVAEGAC